MRLAKAGLVVGLLKLTLSVYQKNFDGACGWLAYTLMTISDVLAEQAKADANRVSELERIAKL